jgi:hypothetical protein
LKWALSGAFFAQVGTCIPTGDWSHSGHQNLQE